MKAHEVMTGNIVSVRRDTRVNDIAQILISQRVSGMPVVTKDNELIGIVSESDLLHRTEVGTEKTRKWWLAMLVDPDTAAREYAKTHGMKAEDIMTRHVVTVDAEADLSKVADVLDSHNIKRVPVLKDGKLVGIITRGDLVRALAGVDVVRAGQRGNDGALQSAVSDKIRSQSWLTSIYINAAVNDGIVELWGFAQSEDQRRGLRVLVEEVEGVREIKDHLKVGFPMPDA